MFAKIFTEHPNSISETYFQHMWFALKTSGKLLYLAGAGIVHAIFPFWHKRTVSYKIMLLNDQLSIRVMETKE